MKHKSDSYKSFQKVHISKHENIDIWSKMIGYCKSYYLYIIVALICAIGGSVFTILGPDKLSEMTDLITNGLTGRIDINLITVIAVTLVIYYLISLILSYIQGYLMAVFTQKISKKMRKQIFEKINHLPLRYFDTTSYGDILSRVTNDVDTIGQTTNQSVGNLVSAVVLLISCTFMMIKTNWIMTIVAILSSLVGFVLMIVVIIYSQNYFTKQQDLLGKLNGHVEEVYTGHNIIQVYNTEKEFKDEFDNINQDFYDCVWKSQFFSGLMMPFMSFISNFGYIAVCICGAYLAMEGVISFGVIVAFIVYVRLFTQPFSQIAQSITSLQSTTAACKRVFEFLEEQEMEFEENGDEDLITIAGDITLDRISFSYTENTPILKDISAKIKSGQKIAIVGPTGSGKTTIVNLLMRFYELDSGTITIDDIPIRNITKKNIHNIFCMVLQDTWLFDGTIYENIVYNKNNVSYDEVKNVCKSIGIHSYIMSLPNGYDTKLNEHVNLSEGQRQLITIARAMIKNSPILILDEATSSVDTRTEIIIQNALDKLMQRKTSIIIAHRLSTIKNADMIFVMKDGKIIEKGNHQSLLKNQGFYSELYNSQFDL